MKRLAEMTWPEVEALDPDRALALLPVGAIEAHGPHLPLATDVIIAEAMAEAATSRLDAAGFQTVILPPLAWTAAPFAAGFSGTVSIAPSAVTAVLTGLIEHVSKAKFRALILANAHLDPTHLESVREACNRATSQAQARLESGGTSFRPPLQIIFPDVTRKPWAQRLTEEFRSGACHAGRYETSIVMAARPDLVRESLRKGLAPNPASLSTAIREQKATFEEAGGPRAYFGWPADASAEEGRQTIQELGAIVAEATLALLPG